MDLVVVGAILVAFGVGFVVGVPFGVRSERERWEWRLRVVERARRRGHVYDR